MLLGAPASNVATGEGRPPASRLQDSARIECHRGTTALSESKPGGAAMLLEREPNGAAALGEPVADPSRGRRVGSSHTTWLLRLGGELLLHSMSCPTSNRCSVCGLADLFWHALIQPDRGVRLLLKAGRRLVGLVGRADLWSLLLDPSRKRHSAKEFNFITLVRQQD
ncbi:uncharacterized protein LOC111256646 [Setaria italica]|uniref:uncharacterized protein LOC111256646 n=1 Tax=Setaria italica TaxID=4555 RepID=UPI000BE60578|nr:uncharacterized protein LOC111256646 [Setaria italica]